MLEQSVFNKIYSFRESENRDAKENYLSEIFAHCLQIDNKLLIDFLNLLGISTKSKVLIKTQTIYEFGRPDIEINIHDAEICILIECKVESRERHDQLMDYSKILKNKNQKENHLVYLSKYYESKSNPNDFQIFHVFKWFDIYRIIDERNNSLSLELKQYLKEENMAESKNFNYSDLNVLTNISGTIHKMDEVLDNITEYYKEKIGTLSKWSARSTQISEDESYTAYHYCEKHNKHHSSISLGFYWWDSQEVNIGACIWLSSNKKYIENSSIFSTIRSNMNDWQLLEYPDGWYLVKFRKTAQFIINEVEQIPTIITFLNSCIDELTNLRKIEPRIFEYGFSKE